MHIFQLWKTDCIPLLALFLLILVSMILLPVNPWPIDGWFQTQYKLFGQFTGQDNYSPIAAPAIFYKIAHWISSILEFDMASEFRVASALQNALLFLSGCFVYYACKLLDMQRIAAAIAIIFVIIVLSTGLPQAFWSENVVLFLISALLFLTAAIYVNESNSLSHFLSLTFASGLVIGLLVATRMIPILFIPAIALLFFGKINSRRVVAYVVLVSLVTSLMLALLVISNHERFGRYELTNSSGRHLWQGVTPFADQALSHLPKYQMLKAVEPVIQGKPWWEIPDPSVIPGLGGISREKLLKELAIEAILNEPWTYIKLGLKKFIRVIGRMPYQLGYGTRKQFNPLETNEFLPSFGESIIGLPASISNGVHTVFNTVHKINRVLYPVTIFFVMFSWFAMYISGIKLFPSRKKQDYNTMPHLTLEKRDWRVAVFFLVGIFTSGIASASQRGLMRVSLVFGLCIAILVGLYYTLALIHRPTEDKIKTQHIKIHGSLYTILMGIFFGSLWLSWQVEYVNPRNSLPYLPLLAVMTAIAITFWSGRLIKK